MGGERLPLPSNKKSSRNANFFCFPSPLLTGTPRNAPSNHSTTFQDSTIIVPSFPQRAFAFLSGIIKSPDTIIAFSELSKISLRTEPSALRPYSLLSSEIKHKFVKGLFPV